MALTSTRVQVKQAANPTPALAPEPVSIDFTQIAGYDAGETQSLQHISGVLTWVDVA